MLALLRAQDEFQRETFGYEFEKMTGTQKMEYIRWNMLALQNELHEALDEADWKPWTSQPPNERGLNLEAYVSELADAFHFFMNLLLVPGVPPEEMAIAFTQRYFAKREKNIQRQAEGYNGKTGKCAGCKRDLADAGVRCSADDAAQKYWCEVYGDIDGNPPPDMI